MQRKGTDIIIKKWSVGWGITSECNMHCQFCYSKSTRKALDDLALCDWKRFVDENAKQIDSINYGTGENAIHDDWFELVKYINDNYKEIKQALTTNGFLFKRIQSNDAFREIVNKAIAEIDISLDFANPERHNLFRGNPNAFSWATSLLEYCQANNIVATIVFIGTNETLDIENLRGLFAIAKKYGANLRMNIYRPTEGINSIAEKFIADYEVILRALSYINDHYKILAIDDPLFAALMTDQHKSMDPSGENSIRVLPDGSITPSTYLIEKEFRCRNIKEDKVLETITFDDSPFERVIPEECTDCQYVKMCEGGVLDRRYLWYRDFKERDPYCPFRHTEYGEDIPSVKIYHPETEFSSVHHGYLATMFFTN